MAYTKTDWKDRVVEKPRTYAITDNGDGTVTLTPSPGTVVQEGTPVNATSMNKIEQGIANAALKTDLDAKFHATTGHKHTGATGDGPLISHLGPPTGSGTWTTDSNGNVTIQHNLGRIPIVVWTRPNYMYRLSNVTTTSFSIQYYSSSSGSGNYWYW